MYKKKRIPKALREQVWLKYNKERFKVECAISWCKKIIPAFNYHVGYNRPESKGGSNTFRNLKPICVKCNLLIPI